MKNNLNSLIHKLASLELHSLANTLTEVKQTIDLIPEDLPKDSYYEEVEHQLQQQELDQQEKQIELQEFKGVFSKLKNILQENDIKVFDHKLVPNFLGSGMSGSVYRGIYQNKEVAIKITESEDISVWNAILNAKAKIPAKYHKFLPRIYKMIPLNDEDIQGIVVMEILEPPDPEIQAHFYEHDSDLDEFTPTDNMSSHGKELKNKIDMNAKLNAENISQIIRKLLDSLEFYISEPKVEEQIKEELSFQLSKHYNEKFYPYWRDTGIKALLEEVASNVSQSNYIINHEDRDYLLRGIENWKNDSQNINISKFQNPFPETSDSYNANISLENSQLQELLELLKLLEGEGILWNDLHEDNIMQRPSTQEIVLTDVDRFIV